MRLILASCVAGCALISAASAGNSFTIQDAINQAVHSNPGVGEAAANRRATEAEMRQSQGVLLPQVRLQLDAGPERTNRYVTPAPLGNNDWKAGRQGSIVVRQLLFDGLASINEIWRQAARTDAAAFRVLERTELIALDAAEAYIDVVRYLRLVALAEDNVTAHRRILGNVRSRVEGGRSGEGDLHTATERVASAEATLAEFRQRLDDARAAYRRVVGLEPYNLRFPGRLRGMPASKDESLAVALRHNPTIQAAGADVAAARYGFDATAGAFLPNVALEGRASRGVDTNDFDGQRDDVSAKFVVTWDVFNGGRDSWRRAEAGERLIEENYRHARLQREAFEALDRAWAARTITSDRIAALTRQVEGARGAVAAYGKEYELGQRTLIDLLDVQNQYFNGLVSLVSTRGVAVFADYQLLAAMGKLLEHLKTGQPPEAVPLPDRPLGPFPLKMPPLVLDAPQPGPEPLDAAAAMPATGTVPPEPKIVTSSVVSDRWPQGTGGSVEIADRWMPRQGATAHELAARAPDGAMSYTATVMNIPIWPLAH